MKRILFLTILATLCLTTACENASKSKDTTVKETPPETKKPVETTTKPTETVKENTENNEATSIEADIQFIREKYAIISKAKNYKTVPFEVRCDERSSSKLIRKYNEEGKLAYLELHDCGGHGCRTKYHYYWDGQLIFIFHKNDYTPGSSHIIEEHRTYFKNGKMIRCLEREANYYDGQPPMEELLKKAKNKEVECTPNKLTENLSEIENLSLDKAKAYFCKS
ncbi:MAG: hypothetical protein AB8B65_00930 [Kordia sp.]|uniref:hypothetical protein n=1 Tax=Kordia sp. TaxID=1965332 RepID=UPI0038595752